MHENPSRAHLRRVASQTAGASSQTEAPPLASIRPRNNADDSSQFSAQLETGDNDALPRPRPALIHLVRSAKKARAVGSHFSGSAFGSRQARGQMRPIGSLSTLVVSTFNDGTSCGIRSAFRETSRVLSREGPGKLSEATSRRRRLASPVSQSVRKVGKSSVKSHDLAFLSVRAVSLR